MMYKEILMQVEEDETKVAVIEDGKLVEIYLERAPDRRMLGNIYKGTVKNVLPGMQAAFVDIGQEKNAFLYVDDALAFNSWQEGHRILSKEVVHPNIHDIIKVGQEIVVQIAKEPTGTKGARVTTQLTVPGRYLVLMPTVDYVGISRRISEEKERERLRAIAESIKPDKMGLIVRTVAAGAEQEELAQDIEGLMKIWQRIKQRARQSSAPVLIHKDLELVQRILRDVFSEDVDRLSVNNRTVKEKVEEFLDVMDVNLKGRVYLCDTGNLFARFDIEQEIAQALKRKVWLKSGGYIVIDELEALTAIDVNTGKYVGSTDLEDTVLTTNSEAAREVARQIRLRNIGGIIIIDFIDMQNSAHREEILRILNEELKKDKMKAHILGITALGLLEMTRKKVRLSLRHIMEKRCPLCEGKGSVLSEDTVYLKLRQDLREAAAVISSDTLVITAHPQVIRRLVGPGGCDLNSLEAELGHRLIIKEKEQLAAENYQISPFYNTAAEDRFDSLLPVEEGQIIKAMLEKGQSGSQDGLARVGNYSIIVENGAKYAGQEMHLEIVKIFRTYAKAKILVK